MNDIEAGESEPMSPLMVLGIGLSLGALLYAVVYDPAKAAAQKAYEAWRERQMWKRYQEYLYGQRRERY